jgi:hypothetical protein
MINVRNKTTNKKLQLNTMRKVLNSVLSPAQRTAFSFGWYSSVDKHKNAATT